ncbi:TIGR04206 family protein [Natrononativus amylolyticus]|uniref:TIGR04206 family protein n=1 Tax=Natrononativus amylolyticus TaxID=2963434 RepID=UPI0020CF2FC4|nr:TIGR04206 family protein [Natrononativus amylolyticus]
MTADQRPPGGGRTVEAGAGAVRARRRAIRWLFLLSPLVVPWVVIRTGETTLLFPWGTLVVESGQLTPIWTFLDQPGPTPEHIARWPLGAACYAFALCWAATARFGADQRVTAGLFVLVAIVVATVSSGFGVDPNRTALPLGSVHALGLAAWVYLGD